MKLLIGTKNPGKVIEIREALAGFRIDCIGAHEHGIAEDPLETGSIFAENALQKARFYREHAARVGRGSAAAARIGRAMAARVDPLPHVSSLQTLADDSGILVEALSRELGIHTRRWGAGPSASDEEWIAYFLERMKQEENKRAQFVCVLAYIDESGTEYVFEGTCEGVITESLEADYLPGLPISACFRPDGFDVVYSAMTVEQKNAVSHRGRAMQRFREHLKKSMPAEAMKNM